MHKRSSRSDVVALWVLLLLPILAVSGLAWFVAAVEPIGLVLIIPAALVFIYEQWSQYTGGYGRHAR